MSANDVDVTGRTGWAEARGDDDPATPGIEEGMEAVICVVVNRAEFAAIFYTVHHAHHLLYGDGTLAGACLRPWQFSCWNTNKANHDYRERILALTPETDRHFALALGIAARADARALDDVTKGATHYHTRAAPSPDIEWPPLWAVGKTSTYATPKHLFYNLGMSG